MSDSSGASSRSGAAGGHGERCIAPYTRIHEVTGMTQIEERTLTGDQWWTAEDEALAKRLDPRAFRARLALWTRGGLSGGMNADLVKSSRAAKLPMLDRMDVAIEQARVRYHAAISDAFDAMNAGDYRKARRLLQSAVALQDVWCYPIEVASETMAELVSDDPTCLYGCVRRNLKTPWRLKKGLCATHYKAWQRAGCPDIHPEAELKAQST